MDICAIQSMRCCIERQVLNLNQLRVFPGKEVFHPQVLLRIPCYDLVPISSFTVVPPLTGKGASGAPAFHDLTGGEYKTQEHIHRDIADSRLLAIPTSWSRVADSNPN